MPCIEAERESTESLPGILFDLVSGSYDSLFHSFKVWILVALDLLCADTVLFDTLLKLVCPLSGTRHVMIYKFVA